MRRRNHFLLGVSLMFQLGVMTWVLPDPMSAQESSQSGGKDTSQTKDTSKSTDTSDASPAPPLGPTWADSYIRQIGTSGLLAGNRAGIGWGSLYIPSAGITGIVDRFGGSNGIPSASFTAAVLQTAVVYDHRLGGSSRLAIQYQPSMAIADGQVVGNFSNQNTNLDLLLYTRPRWVVRFSDSFRYYYTQQSYGLPYFDANPVTSGAITNNFLDGPGRWLSNSASMSAAYALTRRASIAITPVYTFSESGGGGNFVRGISYGGSVNWNYRTSERQTVGIQYTSQLIHQTSGFTTDTIFHTFAVTAQRQVGKTWSVSGSLGATTSAAPQVGRQWSAYGTLGMTKQLGRASVGLNYSRGDTLSSGLISNQYADRVDITTQIQLTRRLNWGAGGGYLRQVQSGGFSGWYATSDLQFLLAPRAGLFATFNYSHKNQSGNTNNLFGGNSDAFSFGIRWQPGKVAH